MYLLWNLMLFCIQVLIIGLVLFPSLVPAYAVFPLIKEIWLGGHTGFVIVVGDMTVGMSSLYILLSCYFSTAVHLYVQPSVQECKSLSYNKKATWHFLGKKLEEHSNKSSQVYKIKCLPCLSWYCKRLIQALCSIVLQKSFSKSSLRLEFWIVELHWDFCMCWSDSIFCLLWCYLNS